jgi:26S proteasome regulatory subunit N2
METDEKEGAAKAEGAAAAEDATTAAEGGKGNDGTAAPKKEPAAAQEPGSFRLNNPCRVTPAQRKYVALEPGCRWRPIHAGRPISGILVLKDLRPGAAGPALALVTPRR